MSDSHKYYVEDCLEILIERSLEAIEIADKSKTPFDQGRSLAYFEVLNTLLNQAEVFEIKDGLKESVRNYSPHF
jgi:hypothetical protein